MLHFALPLATGFVLWVRRRQQYYDYVASLILLSMAGFITYLLIPAAPPWFAANEGALSGPDGRPLIEYLKPVAFEQWPRPSASKAVLYSFAFGGVNPNLVAAFPSLHVAYPFLAFLALRRAFGRIGWWPSGTRCSSRSRSSTRRSLGHRPRRRPRLRLRRLLPGRPYAGRRARACRDGLAHGRRWDPGNPTAVRLREGDLGKPHRAVPSFGGVTAPIADRRDAHRSLALRGAPREDPPAGHPVVRGRPRPREWIAGEAVDEGSRG